MEDGKDSIIEKEERKINKTTDLASLKLLLDYVGFKGIDPTSQLENIDNGKSLVGAYTCESEGVKHFLLITEYDRFGKDLAKGFRVSIGKDEQRDIIQFYNTETPVEFTGKSFSIRGKEIYYKRALCKRIPFQEFSRVYTASKVLMEMKTQLTYE